MKTVREMFVSLTTMLINHIWASIIEICVEKWHTQSLKKMEFKCPDMRNGIDLRRLPPLCGHFVELSLCSGESLAGPGCFCCKWNWTKFDHLGITWGHWETISGSFLILFGSGLEVPS